MTRVRAILFDVDGTLLDSNDAHARAWQEALAEEGFDVAFERIRVLIGMGGDKILPFLTDCPVDTRLGERVTARRAAIFRMRHLPAIEPFPGTRDALVEVGRRDVARGVATSATAEDLGALLDRAGVADVVDFAVSSDDVDRSKPDPDIVTCALAKGRLRPAEVVLVGDTPYDVAAAHRAGVRAVAVRSGGWRDDALAGAFAIYDDVTALGAHLDALLAR